MENKKILVVEDEEYLRDLYVEILKNEGYEVDQAKDGEEAFQAMYHGGYDLVLLDVLLPKLDGFEIMKKLKEETPPQTPNSTVVMLTNLEHPNSIAKGVELGIQGYLIKSDYNPEELLEEIKKYLE